MRLVSFFFLVRISFEVWGLGFPIDLMDSLRIPKMGKKYKLRISLGTAQNNGKPPTPYLLYNQQISVSIILSIYFNPAHT